eukprot:9461447-Pyramimonas_sp.AAC.1
MDTIARSGPLKMYLYAYLIAVESSMRTNISSRDQTEQWYPSKRFPASYYNIGQATGLQYFSGPPAPAASSTPLSLDEELEALAKVCDGFTVLSAPPPVPTPPITSQEAQRATKTTLPWNSSKIATS